MKRLEALAFLLSIICLVAGPAQSPSTSVAFSRRVFALTLDWSERAQKKVDPTSFPGAKGSVLILFRTTEQGAVIDARAVGGTPELQSAAIAVIKQWKFRPAATDGQPVEIVGGLTFDFSSVPAAIRKPEPMTAQQASLLGSPCGNALFRQDARALDWCRQQMTLVETAPGSAMERFTAHDEYGLSLLLYGRDARMALDQFSQAIQLVADPIKPTDAEVGYVYWHRTAAEEQLHLLNDAERDFDVAENSFMAAAHAVEDGKISAYYQKLLSTVLQKHAALFEEQNKHAEALELLHRFELSNQQK